MKNKFFALVLILLFILGLGIFVLPQNEASNQEKRELAVNQNITLNNLVSSSEDVLSDQFYFRNKIVSIYNSLNATLSSMFGTNTINDIEITILSDDVIMYNDGYLSNNILEYTESDVKSAASRGYNLNEFDLTFPDVKTYVYKCTRPEELLNAEYPYQEKCWDAMVGQFNPNISYDELKINGFEDYTKYFYKSDIHWNAYGGYQGYKDIIEMMNDDFDIGEPKKIVNETTYPYKFYGSSSNKLASEEYYDNITNIELEDIGDFDYYIDEELCDFYEFRDIYAKSGNDTPMSDYDYFFGYSALTKLYDFKQEDKPNLLIFSTSFTNTNCMWLASHFNKTLQLDLRCIDENFSLEYYIDKYDIDIALLETAYNTLFFNGYMYIPLD